MTTNVPSPASANAPVAAQTQISNAQRAAICARRDVLDVVLTITGLDNYEREEKNARIESVGQRLCDINARDGQEQMLAAQLVAVHQKMMELMFLSTVPNQSHELRDFHLDQAIKLSGLFIRLSEAMDKHRGKGQQKVIVEHVNVEAGGQAVVGTVETRAAVLQAPPLKTASPIVSPIVSTPPARKHLRSRRGSACGNA